MRGRLLTAICALAALSVISGTGAATGAGGALRGSSARYTAER